MIFWRDLEAFGDWPALISETGAETSYMSLAVRADALATAMSDRLPASVARPLVLIETANAIEPVAAYLGALRAGWPVILAADGATAADPRIRQTYRPNLLFRRIGATWHPELGNPRPVPMHADLALMLSTSGTTGAPKLVRLSAGNLAANAQSIATYLEIGPDERAMTTLPFHYSYGMSVLHTHLLRGAALVLTERSIVDDAFWAAFARNGTTSMALVPFQFDLLDSGAFEQRSLPTLKTITQAGGKLAEPSVRRYAALARMRGWKLVVMYGQTEAAPRMAYVPPEDLEANADAIGRAIPGGRFEIIDANGRPIDATGIAGELVYHGPNVMMGYATSAADLVGPPGPAVLHTGDIAERKPNGFYRVTGRLSRFVKVFGLRIGLDEIEQRLRGEGLAAYATGIDDRITVLVAGHADLADVRARLISAYGLTEAALTVAPLDDVPLLASGKIDYQALAERAARSGQSARPSGTSLAEAFSAALRGKAVDPTKSFVEHGGDSLGYLEVQLALADRLGTVPAAWETMPLAQLEALVPKPQPRWQTVGSDLICRDLALLSVIALHAIALPIAGGVHVLLMLTGYSLARFQKPKLLSGATGSMLRSMLLPILIGYYVILAGVQVAIAPVDPEWFALLGNLDRDVNPHGITPYWFVCLYVQALALVALAFKMPPVQRWAGTQPLALGIGVVATLAGLAVALGIPAETGATAVRHPMMGLQLVALGWCLFHAGSLPDRLMVAVLAAILATMFLPAGPTVPVMLVGAAVAILWIAHVPLPAMLARAAMYFGRQSMYLYLSHVLVVAVLARLAIQSDALMLTATLVASLLGAAIISRIARLSLQAGHAPRAPAHEA